MDFYEFMLKVSVILVSLLSVSVPFLYEWQIFRIDKKKKHTYLRLRPFIATLLYVFVSTFILSLIADSSSIFKDTELVGWAQKKFSIKASTKYVSTVFSVISLNFLLALLHSAFLGVCRINLKKKNITNPATPDGRFTKFQVYERTILRFFNTETWFFIGKIVFYIAGALSIFYSSVLLVAMIPAVFVTKAFPYKLFLVIFNSSYLYPVLTLTVLWQFYFFIEGVKRINDECPDFTALKVAEAKELDLAAIDKELSENFRNFHACDVTVTDSVRKDLLKKYGATARFIGSAINNDLRDGAKRNELYLNCIDKLSSTDKSIIINGNFFSGFSAYFFRYISSIVARGDNLVFVCNSDSQIDSVYDFLTDGLSKISSPYCSGFGSESINFDDPIWKIAKVSGETDDIEEASLDEKSILVTSLSYLCSTRLETSYSKFIPMINTVVFVDIAETLNKFNRQLAILNTRLRHMVKENTLAVCNSSDSEMFRARYISRQIRYVCFDNERINGIDNVLANMLAVRFDILDTLCYSEKTIVRCYNYDPRPNENGEVSYPRLFNTDENLSAAINMAVFLLDKGISEVMLFSGSDIPHKNLSEILSSLEGQVTVNVDVGLIKFNSAHYNPKQNTAVIVMDSGRNLPATIRKYASMMPDAPSFLIIFSMPYMLRDYYVKNIDSLWATNQLEKIPVERSSVKDISQRILIKASCGGISRTEILDLASTVSQFSGYVESQDINSILCEVLSVYGHSCTDLLDVFKVFEYTATHEFNEDGKYVSDVKVCLRRHGNLFDSVNGRDMAVLVTPSGRSVMPIPRNRMAQNYISGQNLIYNGSLYNINSIDYEKGEIKATLTLSSKSSDVYRYLQAREYRMEFAPELDYLTPIKHIVMNGSNGDIAVKEAFISVFRAPMDVVTQKYFDIDPVTHSVNTNDAGYHSICDEGNDILCKQIYRRYGEMETPFYPHGSNKDTKLISEKNEALVMSIRICGAFGPDMRKTVSLAAVMLNEVLHSMFPSVADSVAVCPVLVNKSDMDDAVLKCQPTLTLLGSVDTITENDFQLLIIEDSPSDLGVISALLSGGNDILKTLFSPIFKYLDWYVNSPEKSSYLYFGLDSEPACFDFDSLHKLSALIGTKSIAHKFKEIPISAPRVVCSFCRKKVSDDDSVKKLADGRILCPQCAKTVVPNDSAYLKRAVSHLMLYIESTYGVDLGNGCQFSFEAAAKISSLLKNSEEFLRRNSDLPVKTVASSKKILVEPDIPLVNLSEAILREFVLYWQSKNLSSISPELSEGHVALVIVQYLRFVRESALADTRAAFYESSDTLSGVGYRQLAQILMQQTQFQNNPFRYLLSLSGVSPQKEEPIPTKKIAPVGRGTEFKPVTPDRSREGKLTYFFRSNISEREIELYDVILKAIMAHQETVTASGYSFEEICKISDCVIFDHPEIFWYSTLSVLGDEIIFKYGATEAERKAIQTRLDAIIPEYLKDITDSMSAYDVALHFHIRLVEELDYDTVALRNESPDDKGIDYIRSICGVFLNKKAVCTGYAQAFQYLLQKCGIECAKLSGKTIKSGEGHAWNLVKIDGEYYHIDPTWDDSSDTIQKVKNDEISFSYFCVTTEEILRTRDFSATPVPIPRCSATKANYYYHNKLVINSFDINQLKEFAYEAGKKNASCLTFKCTSKELYEDAFLKLFVYSNDWAQLTKEASKANRKILAGNCSYTHNEDMWIITVIFKYK